MDESKWVILGPRIDAGPEIYAAKLCIIVLYKKKKFEYMDMHCQA